MELMLLVYGIDLLLKLVSYSEFFIVTLVGLLSIILLCTLFASIEGDYSFSELKVHVKKYFPFKTTVLAAFLILTIPNTQTMKYMAAAYIGQTMFESDFVKEAATLSQKAAIKQLKVWAEESPDIKPLLQELGVETGKLSNIENNQEEEK